MKIEQIEQIIEISKTGSLNKAAKHLYISQPNLSMSIKSLEDELNIKIFERSQQGMVLTPIGKQLLYFAEPIYKQYLMMPEVFSNLIKKQKVIFSLSNSYMKFVSNVVSNTINHFSKKPFFIKYLECTSDEVINNVASQISDIGVLYFSSIQRAKMTKLFEYKKLVYTKLMDDGLKIFFGRKNPLYYKKLESITTDMFCQYPIIVYNTPQTSELTEAVKLKLGNAPRLIIVNNRGSKLDLVLNTNAIGIGTCSAIPYQHTDFYKGIKTLPIENVSFEMEIGWVCRQDFDNNEVSEFFLKELNKITSQKTP